VVSNGHGEETIGVAVIDAVRAFAGAAVVIEAVSMVGDGAADRAGGVTSIADGLQLPSEGFGTLSAPALVADRRAG